MIRFTAQSVTLDAAAGDQPRTISGIAAPYGVDANVSTGQTVRLEAGSLPTDGPAPRLLLEHDASAQPVGMVTAREDTPEGMLFTAEIARTRAGDDLVELLKMGAYDSVSIGIEATDVEQDGRTTIVKAANWKELSVVFEPAFAAAKITQIAASAEDEESTENPETTSEEEEPMSEITPEVVEAAAEPTPTPTVFAQPKSFKLPSASEWIAAAMEGGHRWHTMNENIRAAAPDVTTTNNDGVLPEPIVGPVYNDYLGIRPVVDAFGAKAMPAAGGKVFIRPSVSTHTSMAAQSSELATLQAGEFQVQENQVTKASYGGYVTLSEQISDWSDPSIINLVLEDMGKVYAQTTDNVAADALVAGATTTGNFTAASIADPTEWLSWLYANAAYILENAGNGGHLPTHLFVSAANWEALGKLEDGSGRPLFPQVGPMNAFGTTTPGTSNFVAFGLQVVVDTNFANTGNGTMILGDTVGFEIFEQQKGFLRVQNAQIRGTDISWLGYFSTLMLDANRYVKAAFV
jgi:HK97 family phage prohead protease